MPYPLLGKRVVAVFAVLVALSVLSSLNLASHRFPLIPQTQHDQTSFSTHEHTDPVEARLNVTDEGLEPKHWLKGPPTRLFRDNLLPDVQYITSFASAGWTNDVIAISHLVYLGMLTDRVPVIPPFAPVHISPHEGMIPFGEVFDLPRFRALLGIPVLEWEDVKDVNMDLPAQDIMGCISVWLSQQNEDPRPRGSRSQDALNFDISYTKAPAWIKLHQGNPHSKSSTFWSLASLAFRQTREANLGTPIPSPHQRVSLPPDDHLLCYDYLYYVVAVDDNEWDKDYSPAWRFVGKHLYWTKHLKMLADAYVRAAMNINSKAEPTPQYISVHVRHHDFAQWCRNGPEDKDCFAPISAIARRVQEVRDELAASRGIAVPSNRVIVLSDEVDEAWWSEVAAQGWLRINHEHTTELYGAWYGIFIDAVIQSGGKGFVGTDLSTMSLLAKRRVEDWNNGVTRMVKWGFKDADAH